MTDPVVEPVHGSSGGTVTPGPWTTHPQTAGQRFELRGRIGAGNHGVVFRAYDHQLRREVAIKRFSHFLADDPRTMRRITREVETLARVSHPNVVTVFDLVQMPDGDGEVTPHVVMELVDGTSMRDVLAEHGPSPRAVVAVKGVLEGLAACHASDILHLDIKPANVLVTRVGGVKIVDFGIARAASDATATVAGTPHYMAPEQYEGHADERSDIYSVGCLLYESLTGVPPFEGTMASQVMAHRTAPRPDPRDRAHRVSPALAQVVMRAMAVDPRDRFPSVQAMLAALTPDVIEPLAESAAPAPAWVPTTAEPVVAEPAVQGASPVERATAFTGHLVVAAAIVGLVPVVAWGSTELVSTQYRLLSTAATIPPFWWMLAVAISALYLGARWDRFTDALRSARAGRSVRMATSASLRGAIPLLFPWYATGVGALTEYIGMPWAGLDGWWLVAWVLMPLASTVLFVRGLTHGGFFSRLVNLFASAGAAFLFLVVPGIY